ncbi:hypothetical protein NMA58_00720 [Rhizobium sp. YTUHZ045]|uniref:hypothetical protein n=1 Tax=Rhizobium sp. YTUHZ045 TaxID=2962888 RepID=UPI003DA9B322
MMNRPPGISRASSSRPHVRTNSEHQRFERVRRHKRLLAIITASAAQFEREVQSRRRLLLGLEPPAPIDPLIIEIEKQWARLYLDYRRYRKAVPYPGERGGWG